ncbi:hypothetical protein C8Q79DRAFT_13062 [Trametes meyenii]|nr:hypothetical protein C8Q79DRAFT_13062 [Trametes meyenii]
MNPLVLARLFLPHTTTTPLPSGSTTGTPRSSLHYDECGCNHLHVLGLRCLIAPFAPYSSYPTQTVHYPYAQRRMHYPTSSNKCLSAISRAKGHYPGAIMVDAADIWVANGGRAALTPMSVLSVSYILFHTYRRTPIYFVLSRIETSICLRDGSDYPPYFKCANFNRYTHIIVERPCLRLVPRVNLTLRT